MAMFQDALTLDAPRRTADGYLAVRARAARTGVYQYAGSEIDPDNAHGLRDKASVNVLRDEAAVFDERAMRSFIGKPITSDHPSEPVTAANWKRYSDGVIMGAVRDGQHLAFDLLLMDAQAIADVEAGKRQLSNGYSSKLQFGDFTAADGTKCEARQDQIFGNHVARVDLGRAGPSCAITDAVATCDTAPPAILNDLKTEKPVKTMLIDGLTVDVSNADTAVATINTLIAARDTAAKDLATARETIAARDTDIATLKTEKKALEDAKPTPAQLRDAAKAYALVAGKAKALGVDVTDSMDEIAIKRAVVDKHMGDAAKGWNDAEVGASFAVLAKDAKVPADTVQRIGAPVVVGDAAKQMTDAWTAANDHNAWRTAGAGKGN